MTADDVAALVAFLLLALGLVPVVVAYRLIEDL